MLEANSEILRRINGLQILLEALTDELIENNLISESSILKRIDKIKDELNEEEVEVEYNGLLYFGPKGEA